MGTQGTFAYRYKGKYYRQHFRRDAYPSGHGQWLIDAVPRGPSAFKDTNQTNVIILETITHTNTQDWVADRINMLEKSRIGYDEVDHPSDGGDADGLSFELVHNADWTYSKWTYVIDLDDLRFTVNSSFHFNLDNLPL